jgi:hypothetical protein
MFTMRQKLVRGHHGCHGVDHHDGLRVGRVVVLPEHPAANDAGIVNQNVHAAVFGDDGRGSLFNGFALGEVNHHAVNDNADRCTGRDLTRRLLEGLLVHVPEHHNGRALGRGTLGIHPTHAHGRAGDDESATSDVQTHALSLTAISRHNQLVRSRV